MELKNTNQEQEINGSSRKKLKNRQMKVGSEKTPLSTTQKRVIKTVDDERSKKLRDSKNINGK